MLRFVDRLLTLLVTLKSSRTKIGRRNRSRQAFRRIALEPLESRRMLTVEGDVVFVTFDAPTGYTNGEYTISVGGNVQTGTFGEAGGSFSLSYQTTDNGVVSKSILATADPIDEFGTGYSLDWSGNETVENVAPTLVGGPFNLGKICEDDIDTVSLPSVGWIDPGVFDDVKPVYSAELNSTPGDYTIQVYVEDKDGAASTSTTISYSVIKHATWWSKPTTDPEFDFETGETRDTITIVADADVIEYDTNSVLSPGANDTVKHEVEYKKRTTTHYTWVPVDSDGNEFAAGDDYHLDDPTLPAPVADTHQDGPAQWKEAGTAPSITIELDPANPATNGSTSLQNGAVTFTPTAGHTGAASYGYIATAGSATASGGVSITVKPPLPSISVVATRAATVENDDDYPVTFTFTRTGDAANALTVAYAIAGTGANPVGDDSIVGGDYDVDSPTSITFAAGASTAILSLYGREDDVQEEVESGALTVSAGSGYTVGGSAADFTISDRPTVDIAIKGINVAESSGTATFLVTVTGTLPGAVRVSWTTTDDTATSPDDYADNNNESSILIDATTIDPKISISVVDDEIKEGSEQFKFKFTSVVYETPDQFTERVRLTYTTEYVIAAISDDDQPEEKKKCDCTCGASVNSQTGNTTVSADPGAGPEMEHNSSGMSGPRVNGEFKMPANAPSQIRAELTFGGNASAPVFYDTTNLEAGDIARIVMPANIAGLGTGMHDYELRIVDANNPSTVLGKTSGKREYVNVDVGPNGQPIANPFGVGWSIRGLKRLVVQPGGVTVVEGGGTASFYRSDIVAGRFVTALGHRDQLVRNADNTYTLTALDGSREIFDAAGKLTAKRELLGEETSYVYEDGLLKTITDSRGLTTSFAYTAGRLSSITDPQGRTANFVIDAGSGRLTEIQKPAENSSGTRAKISYDYDVAGRITDRIDEKGVLRKFDYDFAGQIKQIRQGDNTHDFYAYQSRGLVDTSWTDPEHPELGTLGSETNPAPLYLSDTFYGEAYDGDVLGEKYQMDRYGNRTWEQDINGVIRRWARDGEGRVLTFYEPNPTGGPDLVTSYTYDRNGNRLTQTNPDSSTESWEYDLTWNKVSEHTDAVGRVTRYTYDSGTGLMLTMTQVMGAVDGEGNSEIDDLTTTYTYDLEPDPVTGIISGHLISETDPLGNTTSYTYNGLGQVLTVTDPLNHTTTYDYDAFGRQTKVIDPLGRTTSTTYNPAGRVESVTDPLGQVTSYQYDYLGRVILESFEAKDKRGHTDVRTTTTVYNYDDVTRHRFEITTDTLGYVTSQEFDDHDHLIKSVDALNHVTTYGYDDEGRQTDIIDATGVWTHTKYDAAGNALASYQVIGVVDSSTNGETNDILTASYHYNDLGQQDQVTDGAGRVTKYGYDVHGRQTSTRQVVGVDDTNEDYADDDDDLVTTVSYNAVGQVVTSTDVMGRVTQYIYDDAGRQTAVIQVVGELNWESAETDDLVQTYRYDKAGRPVYSKDPLGRVTESTYDAAGRLTKQKDPTGAETNYDYDAANQLIEIIDGRGKITRFGYDDLGRQAKVIQVVGLRDWESSETDDVVWETQYFVGAGVSIVVQIDPLERETTTVMNRLGQVITQTNAANKTTTFSYDANGRQKSVTDPLGRISSTTYDDAGRIQVVTDPSGRTTTYHYSILGRLTEIVDSAAGTTYYTYHLDGSVDTVSDPRGRTTQYLYDDLGRNVGQIDSLAGTSSVVLRKDGSIASSTDALNQTTTFEYDPLGRRTKVIDPQLAETVTVYDKASQVVRVIDPQTNITDYTYDGMGRLASVLDANGGLTQYKYDGTGNREELIDPVGNKTTWVYDDLGRMTDETIIVNQLNKSRVTDYNAAGEVIRRTDRNGDVIEYTYNSLGLLTHEKWLDGAAVVRTLTWTYDDVGRLLSASDPDSSTTYGYNDIDQLTGVTIALPGLSSVTFGQTYTPYGQRQSVTATIGTHGDFTNGYQYDALGRLNLVTQTSAVANPVYAISDKRVDLQYNALGQFTSISRYSVVGGAAYEVSTAMYGYDESHRITRLMHTQSGSTQAGYTWTYDNAGRMLSQTDVLHPLETVTYTHDATGQLTGVHRAAVYQHVNAFQTDSTTWNNEWVNGATPTYTEPVLTGYHIASYWGLVPVWMPQYDIIPSDLTLALQPHATALYTNVHNGYDIASHEDWVNTLFPAHDSNETTPNPQWPLGSYTPLYDENEVLIGYHVDDYWAIIWATVPAQHISISEYTWQLGPWATPTYEQVISGYRIAAHEEMVPGWTNEQTVGPNDLTSETTPYATPLYSTPVHNGYYVNEYDRLLGGELNTIYTYDDNGNRITGGYEVDPNNQTSTDGRYNYDYDDEGQRIRRTEIATGHVTEYAWDHRHRLTSVTERVLLGGANTLTAAYAYDTNNLRIKKVVDADGAGPDVAETTQTVYDGTEVVLAFHNGSLTNRYLHGEQADQVFADEELYPNWYGTTVLWPATDHLGTARDLIDSAGTVINHRQYDSFGNLTAESNAAVDHIFGYTGREYDAETGLNYHRARYLDPAIGKWISEDPIGFAAGDNNLNRYVSNSVDSFTDATGLAAQSRIVLRLVKEYSRGGDDESRTYETARVYATLIVVCNTNDSGNQSYDVILKYRASNRGQLLNNVGSFSLMAGDAVVPLIFTPNETAEQMGEINGELYLHTNIPFGKDVSGEAIIGAFGGRNSRVPTRSIIRGPTRVAQRISYSVKAPSSDNVSGTLGIVEIPQKIFQKGDGDHPHPLRDISKETPYPKFDKKIHGF